jgi:hypothetical protein
MLKDVLLAKTVDAAVAERLPLLNVFYFYDVVDYLTAHFYGGDHEIKSCRCPLARQPEEKRVTCFKTGASSTNA